MRLGQKKHFVGRLVIVSFQGLLTYSLPFYSSKTFGLFNCLFSVLYFFVDQRGWLSLTKGFDFLTYFHVNPYPLNTCSRLVFEVVFFSGIQTNHAGKAVYYPGH